MSNDNVLQSTVYVGSDKRYYDTAATRLLVLYDGKITEYNLMEMNKDRLLKAGRYIIYDNHSTNGVFVNGERIENSMSVIDGDIIQLAGIFIVITSGSIIYQSEPGGVSLTLHNVNKTVKSNGEKKRKILNHVFCNIDNNDTNMWSNQYCCTEKFKE